MSHTTRMRLSFVLAIAVLLTGILGVVPPASALVAGWILAVCGGLSALLERHDVARRRSAADDMLEYLPAERVPGRLRWRVDELTCERERLRLARSLRSLLEMSESPLAARYAPVPLDWRSIRSQRGAVEEVARLLADIHRPVTPRGMLLVRRLILDSLESPLYGGPHADELGTWLERARAALPRRPA